VESLILRRCADSLSQSNPETKQTQWRVIGDR
jgi:hypothetical protein